MKTVPSTTIYCIAAFKLFKAITLLMVGLGALHLVHRDIAETLGKWAHEIHIDPESRHLHRFIEKAFNANPKQLKELAAGTFFYAGLLFTEGIGLLLRRRWAEYFTIIMTALFLPLEVYELIEKLTVTRVIVLIINAGIVWYLIERVRKSRSAKN
ncbi:MAG TPA: DUF2127 domain-containing protein [Bryobacteraceae bacterium]|jgi:uncharacterized membrane protein (DUF2068 family)